MSSTLAGAYPAGQPRGSRSRSKVGPLVRKKFDVTHDVFIFRHWYNPSLGQAAVTRGQIGHVSSTNCIRYGDDSRYVATI